MDHNETKTETCRWTVAIEVARMWVEDGFDLTPEILQAAIKHALPYAYKEEVTAEIIKAPPPALIKGLQKH
jgi:hypothetical protein